MEVMMICECFQEVFEDMIQVFDDIIQHTEIKMFPSVRCAEDSKICSNALHHDDDS